MQELKVGVGKFIVGQNAINRLETEMQYFGKKAFIIGGKTSIEKVNQYVDLSKLGIVNEHIGECSRNWAKQYARALETEQCELVIGIGGGKCIDLAKCVATYANCPIMTVPTSVATCVASSAVCIMYTDEGRADGSVAMNREVDVVITDSEIIRRSPKRLWAAGMVDSLAKLPEVIHNLDIKSYKDCDLNKYICYVNGKAIWDFIIGNGIEMADNLETSDKIEDMIITNLIHTSIVSGFSSGSGQLALAHGLYDFVRREFPSESRESMHGEIVGVGLIMQMDYNGSGKEIFELINFMNHFNMPMTLREINFDIGKIDMLVDYLIKNTEITDVGRLRKSLQRILGGN